MNALMALVHGLMLLWKVLSVVDLVSGWLRERRKEKIRGELEVKESFFNILSSRSRYSPSEGARWVREQEILPWYRLQIKTLETEARALSQLISERLELLGDSEATSEINNEISEQLNQIVALISVVKKNFTIVYTLDDQTLIDEFLDFQKERISNLKLELKRLEELS